MAIIYSVFSLVFLCFLALPPFVITWISLKNISFPDKSITNASDLIVLTIAPVLTVIFGNCFLDISNNPWTEINVNNALHAPIWPNAIPTFITLIVLSLLGYLLLNFIPLNKIPPLLLAIGVGLLYLGIFLSICWSVQMLSLLTKSPNLGVPAYILMCLMPWNYLLICLRVIIQVLRFWNEHHNDCVYRNILLQKLSHLISKVYHFPIKALLLLLPILGIAIVILILFGQEPDAIIKMWTNTSDWTLSQKTSPPSVMYDEHYLCTVGASGHRKLVKPLRMGVRHGHRIVVNRQLLIANAFEQVLEERIPRIHRLIRMIYDKYGFPLSRLIKTSWQADIIYLLMKPLEWFFLLILYLVDVKPENRIALQYFIKPTN